MQFRRGGWRRSAASLFWTTVAVFMAWQWLRERCRRYVVVGSSMKPTLWDGDWVLVDTTAYRNGRRPRVGDLVLAQDPREPSRVVFKRVARRNPGGVWLLGDQPEASTDSRTFGWVPDAAVLGRGWFRYWPLSQLGTLH